MEKRGRDKSVRYYHSVNLFILSFGTEKFLDKKNLRITQKLLTRPTSAPKQTRVNNLGATSRFWMNLLNGMVSDSMMEEFVDMTSGDPTFNSLFALFNTDRDKFLNSERQKLQLSASEVEGRHLCL